MISYRGVSRELELLCEQLLVEWSPYEGQAAQLRGLSQLVLPTSSSIKSATYRDDELLSLAILLLPIDAYSPCSPTCLGAAA